MVFTLGSVSDAHGPWLPQSAANLAPCFTSTFCRCTDLVLLVLLLLLLLLLLLRRGSDRQFVSSSLAVVKVIIAQFLTGSLRNNWL